MKTKHAPWKTLHEGQLNGEPNPCWQSTIIDSSEEEIAVVWGKTEEECKANAQLMAAPMELLKALRGAKQALELFADGPNVSQEIADATEAIQKATP